MSAVEFRLPDLGEGLQEATIVGWHVEVGDHVELNQPLCEVETDKATAEIPSPVSGTITALGGSAGQVIPVGQVLARIDSDDTTPLLVGAGGLIHDRGDGPLRRRRAAVITTSPTVDGSSDLILLEGVRARLAERMEQAHRDIPDAACRRELDATALLAAAAHHDVTPFAIILRCVADALSRHPNLNASFDPAARAVRHSKLVNLAVAVETERGLVAPVIHEANANNIAQMARALRHVADAARGQTLTPTDVSGGTFTVSNHGVFGTDDGYPIINHPQAAILAVGAIKPRPFVVDDVVMARSTVILTLVFDHRICDGADGARFLADLASLIANPPEG
jgi:2-oxoisovalerate dehydrogenase E2 component (dihydrolipoyl transacylase)